MEHELECPKCNHKFFISEDYQVGDCPNCGKVHYYMIFYPSKPGGSSFTIASDYDVLSMKKKLDEKDVGAMVGFGPEFHRGGSGREPKSMVVILFNPKKDKEIVNDIIRRNFSLYYPNHQLG